MQSRDLVEAHRLVFSAKLYDHQGPIARGGRTNPPPLTVRVMRNALTGRGLKVLVSSNCTETARPRCDARFEILGNIFGAPRDLRQDDVVAALAAGFRSYMSRQATLRP